MPNIQKLIFNDNVLDVSNISSGGFASGTKILFYQNSAPTGWTIDTSANDCGVRIVSSSGGTISGSTAFSSIFKSSALKTTSSTINVNNITSGATKLSVAQLASHNHRFTYGYNNQKGGSGYPLPDNYDANADAILQRVTSSVGSNSTHTHSVSFNSIGSHSHNITLNLKYVNLLICIKN